MDMSYMADNATEAANLTPQQYCGQIAAFLQEHPDAWTRGEYARTSDNDPCDPDDDEAVKLCTLGLIMKFVRNDVIRRQCERLCSRTITPYNSPHAVSIVSFNDGHAKDVQDVVAMFRAASYLPNVPDPVEAPDKVKALVSWWASEPNPYAAKFVVNEYASVAYESMQHLAVTRLEQLSAKIDAQMRVIGPPDWGALLVQNLELDAATPQAPVALPTWAGIMREITGDAVA